MEWNLVLKLDARCMASVIGISRRCFFTVNGSKRCNAMVYLLYFKFILSFYRKYKFMNLQTKLFIIFVCKKNLHVVGFRITTPLHFLRGFFSGHNAISIAYIKDFVYHNFTFLNFRCCKHTSQKGSLQREVRARRKAGPAWRALSTLSK